MSDSLIWFSFSNNAAKMKFYLGGKRIVRVLIIIAVVYLIVQGFDPSPLLGGFVR